MSESVTAGQLDILRHTLGLNDRGSTDGGRRNWFATTPNSRDGKICKQLVDAGLMDYCGFIEWAGEDLYRATEAGRIALAKSIKPASSMTRSQRRYDEFLRSDSGLSFGEWIKVNKGTNS